MPCFISASCRLKVEPLISSFGSASSTCAVENAASIVFSFASSSDASNFVRSSGRMAVKERPPS
jgi:hypothetical protein